MLPTGAAYFPTGPVRRVYVSRECKIIEKTPGTVVGPSYLGRLTRIALQITRWIIPLYPTSRAVARLIM